MEDMISSIREIHTLNNLPRPWVPTPLSKTESSAVAEAVNELSAKLDAACDQEDFERQAVALTGLVFISLSGIVSLGLPWGPLWDAVLAGIRSGHEGPFELTAILKEAGYDPNAVRQGALHLEAPPEGSPGGAGGPQG